MVGHVRLPAPSLLNQGTHAFLARQQRFDDQKACFVRDGAQHVRALSGCEIPLGHGRGVALLSLAAGSPGVARHGRACGWLGGSVDNGEVGAIGVG